MQLVIVERFFMKLFKNILLLIICILSCSAVFAQVDTAFWFAVPHITHDHAGRPIKLCVTTLDSPATITITKPAAGNAVVGTFTVPANSSHYHQIVGGDQDNLSNIADFECNQNQTSNYGLYIHSTAKVNAYIAIQSNNSEIYALKGANALGTHFFIPMQYQYTNATLYNDARNSVEVIATEDNTSVTITPSVALYGGTHPANTPFTVMLNKGQVYSFASAQQSGSGHLCGTVITSTKPIVVDVSDDSATPNGSNQDLVADQIVPEELAGTEYIVVPSPTAANNTNGSQGLSDYAFIFALEDATNVIVYSYASATSTNVTQTEYSNLNRGAKRSYHFTNNNPIFVYSNKPVLVFQVTGAGNELGGTLLPHVYCTGSTQASYMPLPHPQGSSHVKHIYLTLLCKQQYISGFLINGQSNYLTENDWKTIPGTFSYKYCRKEITSLNTASSIRITNSLGKFHLGVIDFHQPSSNSYDDCSISYFSDYSTSSKLSWDTGFVHSDYCQGDTIYFAFDTVDVNQLRVYGPNGFSDESDPQFLANVMPENTGFYRVEGHDSRNCLIENFTDTIWIEVHPSLQTTVRDTVCPGVEYEGYGFHIDADLTGELGTVTDSMVLQESMFGCDSVVTLELTIRDSVKQHTVYDEVCYGEAYNGFGGLFHFPADSALEVKTLLDTVHLTPEGGGCDSLLILELTVRDSVRAEFNKTACNQYTWNGHTYVETGDYIQTLDDANGCDSVVTMHLEIEVPEVEIVTSGEDFCEYGELILTAETDYEEYIWSTGETSPYITVTQPGLYTVTVTEGECQASEHYTVPTCEFNIFMPNAISPSKSDGLNDYLSLPAYVHRFLTSFEIEIYDRWGELIYWNNDMNFKWYGENAHIEDVYVWVIRVKNLDGKQFTYRGTVTVL